MTRSDPPRDTARRAPGVPPPGSAAPVAVTEACSGCGACLLTCPTHAIRPVAGSGSRAGQPSYAALTVLADRCTGCLECVEICPADAVTVLTPGPSSP